jgi:3-oxoadipate enol-lactonase
LQKKVEPITLFDTSQDQTDSQEEEPVKQLVNGIQMNYEDVGNGPALLLIHGFPLDHTLWTYQLESLRNEYRLVAPDLRGHGKSQTPPGPYRMEQMAQDLCDLIDSLKIERVVLVGLSMGGYIAFASWRLYPHRVRALVLADTRAVADTPQGRQNRQESVQRVQAQGTQAIVEGMLPRLLSPNTLRNKPKVVAHARRMMTNTPATGVVGALQGMAERPDATLTLSTITVPTLIVVGADDAITPPAEAEAMRETILSAQGERTAGDKVHGVIIPDAGHLTPLENPPAFNQALREFLAGLPG